MYVYIYIYIHIYIYIYVYVVTRRPAAAAVAAAAPTRAAAPRTPWSCPSAPRCPVTAIYTLFLFQCHALHNKALRAPGGWRIQKSKFSAL